ncbi:hypothetical protein C1637_04060 [Chryseobacterium lactis]|uniref:Uncharacterized protein n=1 Tax=Chryseobacterium lactis TaxID=1241981 RepID=A0A3G6RY63_CHRLC|nr:hypothetical protein [Chryseobacterium lactis]AZA81758.1 hypothetical protein EG342_07455 [Chryseobacterium lactis]AZB06756.1 hypothetical protein EG341_23575 [Chryseobacterium lactis]PNW15607.1 hypothetical protein C1637_04060 [Chryseobacterium lactis]
MSAGLGEVFSASGFLSTVANGALTGAGTGGVTALITGQNFLEGVWKGAVIGGVAAIGYTLNFFSRPRYSELTKAEYDALEIPPTGEFFFLAPIISWVVAI